MPKDKLKRYLRKIKKIERKINLIRRRHSSEDRSPSRARSRSPFPDHDSEKGSMEDGIPISIVQQASTEDDTPLSIVQQARTPSRDEQVVDTELATTASEINSTSQEVLLALGDLMPEKPQFGPAMNKDVARIWTNVLKNGLSKESKQKLEKLVPENCALLQAPKLNQEISTSVTDNIVNRDKKIETEQNQLATGLAYLGTALSSLIENEEVDRLQIITILSDAGRVLTDLHYLQTRSRKNLVSPVLDKKFLEIVKDVERDEFLYGSNLSEKIKTLKTAQRSGQSIKKPTVNQSRQGNSSGPPRFNQQRTARQGHKKIQSSPHAGKYRSQYYPPPAKKPRVSAQQVKPAARK